MFYFLIPVYNESPNLDQLAENLKAALPGEARFYIFVDDGSSDDTVSKLSSLFSYEPHHIITKEKNAGPGHSFNLGFKWVLENSKNDGDFVITIEADNTSDPGLLPKMTAIAKMDFDLVLASVYAQGGGFEKSSFFRKLISFSANFFLRFAFNIKVQTLSSFYRIYRVSLLRKISSNYPEIISENGFVCMFEILLKAINQKASVIEVPVKLMSANRKGKSKMKILRTMRQYMRFTLKASFRGL
jgi:dolichol-phosphate mannosyltransferase